MNFTIAQVARLLGFSVKNKSCEIENERSFNVQCPICNDRDYKLNIDNEKDCWRCVKCGAHGGAMDLYIRFGMGLNAKACNKENRRKAANEIEKLLGMDYTPVNAYQRKEYTDDHTKLSDTELNNIYSKILSIPVLKLSREHKNDLMKRGLTMEDIHRNGYRSLTTLKQDNFNKVCLNSARLKRMGKANILSGIFIGQYLVEHYNLNLKGVPGFFKVMDMWCFNYTPGILIPVRNFHKEIVGFQIRTNSGSIRYITVSSKGYEEGTAASCRVHFPLNNPTINEDTIIRLTEGPLKADVASSLTNSSNIIYISISGVNTTRDLEKNILPLLKEHGCHVIYNALDIDKITNPNVAKGSIRIKQIIKSAGMKYKQLFWDEGTAAMVLQKQSETMKEHNIVVDYPSDNVFIKVFCNTMALSEAKIDIRHEWPNHAVKGIDDYLLSIQNKTA